MKVLQFLTAALVGTAALAQGELAIYAGRGEAAARDGGVRSDRAVEIFQIVDVSRGRAVFLSVEGSGAEKKLQVGSAVPVSLTVAPAPHGEMACTILSYTGTLGGGDGATQVKAFFFKGTNESVPIGGGQNRLLPRQMRGEATGLTVAGSGSRCDAVTARLALDEARTAASNEAKGGQGETLEETVSRLATTLISLGYVPESSPAARLILAAQ